MKKILFVLTIFLLGTASTFAATEHDQNAASFLTEKNIIAASFDYKLDSTITRREMLKVMMNLSGKTIASNCTGKFKDLPSSDWGCKYAEAALANGYISANTNFRPNDSVTNIEALKMVMQARNIPKATEYSRCDKDCSIIDWQTQYIEGATNSNRYLYYKVDNEGKAAFRSDVFMTAATSFDEFESATDLGDILITVPLSYSFDEEPKGVFNFGVRGSLELVVEKTDLTFEEYIADYFKKGYLKEGESLVIENIQTHEGLKGRMIEKGMLGSTIFFETDVGNYAILGYINVDYKSFQIK